MHLKIRLSLTFCLYQGNVSKLYSIVMSSSSWTLRNSAIMSKYCVFYCYVHELCFTLKVFAINSETSIMACLLRFLCTLCKTFCWAKYVIQSHTAVKYLSKINNGTCNIYIIKSCQIKNSILYTLETAFTY